MKTRSLIVAFSAAVLLAVAGFQAIDLSWQRERARFEAKRRAASQAIALAEYVRGAFAAADSALRQLAIHGEKIGGPSAPSSEWLPILEAVRAAQGEQGSLSVTDAGGVIRHSTLRAIVGESRNSHYLFRHLSSSPTDQLVLDVPFVSHVSPGRWVVPAGRRLRDGGGRFDGMVVQVVSPERFRPFFGAVRIGDEGVIKLFHPDGQVILRQPWADLPSEEHDATQPLYRAASAGPAHGIHEGPIRDGGPPFVSAYRKLDSPPLLVTVSLSEREILADWRIRRNRAIAELLGLSAVFAILGFVVVRQAHARSRIENALADVRRREADTLRTANERLEEALGNERQAREESERANRLKDEFLMTLSHELRTPLNAILGWLHMVRTRALAPETRDQALATIERNANAQARLIEDLLDVSRAVTGKLQLHLTTVDVGEVVRATAATLQPAIAARQIALEVDMPPPAPRIRADADRIQQVVWNLLANAIKFSVPGGRVRLRVAREADGIEILVRDEGVGIAPAFLPHVFDRFRQADAGLRREHGGLGIGLSIARHLVELHGGTITACSEGEGRGATFRVHLPAGSPELRGAEEP